MTIPLNPRLAASQADPVLPWPAFIDRRVLEAHGIDDLEILARAMRPEEEVMRPERLRAAKATRLSITRRLVERMTRSNWSISQRLAEIEASGAGLLVYDIDAEGFPMSFVVWSATSDGEADRLGRFYEHEYDFYGAVFEGRVTVERARDEASRMRCGVWSGRTDRSCLGWTVANRSNRFFNHVLEELMAARQPDLSVLASGGGYIIRNAGWYGNGRHGSRSWLSLPLESPFAAPYFIDLFALYMWRTVGCDVAELTAQARRDGAAAMSADVRRYLGVGNSSGIGMVAALVRWPAWLGTFCSMREVVRAYVVTRPATDEPTFAKVEQLLARAADYYALQPAQAVAEAEQPERIASGLCALLEGMHRDRGKILGMACPWAELARRAASHGSLEVEEQVTSVLMEIAPDFADAIAGLMRQGMATTRLIDPCMTCGKLLAILQDRYRWALDIDFSVPGASEHFWYKSEENGENRRGERAIDPGLENETFVNVAGAAQELAGALREASANETVGLFLLRQPHLSHMAGRAQLSMRIPYSEIRANIIARDFLPMDGIRFLLGLFGLEASAPYSTRWVRGVFLQGAPLPTELAAGLDPAWMFPGGRVRI